VGESVVAPCPSPPCLLPHVRQRVFIHRVLYPHATPLFRVYVHASSSWRFFLLVAKYIS
jgi:hypothetical protein